MRALKTDPSETGAMPHPLFQPYDLRGLHLKNRIAMAPMTRCRAADGDVPTPLMAEYYTQRATAGLIISEGTPVTASGRGYLWTPGIYSPEQIAGWRQIAPWFPNPPGVAGWLSVKKNHSRTGPPCPDTAGGVRR